MLGSSLMSIGQISLAANWFLEGNYVQKIKSLYRNKLFWILSSTYLLHLIGMLYTQNTDSGWLDLGIKIPLLILPILFFSTKPLNNNELKILLYTYFIAILASSIYCYLVYLGYTKHVITNPQNASVFVPHIRFSLCVAFAICGLVYYSIKEKYLLLKFVFLLVSLWLLFFMYRLEMMTGFACLFAVASVFSLYLMFKRLSKKWALIFGGVSLLTVIYTSYYINKSLSWFDADLTHPQNTLLNETANKKGYLQDTIYGLAENGNLIGININDYELQKEWEQRSKIAYTGSDKKGNELRYTILHYLASKGLTKDSVGIHALSNTDINFIEQGYTNYLYTSSSLIARWRKLMWEYTKYKRGENPSGHTLTMRLEFWKVATVIIQQSPVFGVGTGDVQDSFNKTYTETNTKLDKRWWLRCHNQYLAIAVAFGTTGLILFLFYLLYPAIAQRQNLHQLYWCFFITALLSFVTEDTLENQAGATFFAFFNTLFLWLAYFKDKENYNSLNE